jgi:hypothetical protein
MSFTFDDESTHLQPGNDSQLSDCDLEKELVHAETDVGVHLSKKKPGSVLGNNLRVLGLHIAISFMTFFMVLITAGMFSTASGQGEVTFDLGNLIGIAMIGLVIIFGFGSYIFAGYMFLKPLPKHNLLSVSFLALFFMTVAVFGIITSLVGPLGIITPFVEYITAFLAFSACFIALISQYSMDFIMGGYYYNPQFEQFGMYIILFFSATIPTLFMYIGLRLKIKKQKG